MTGKTVPSQTPAAEDRSSWRRDLPTLMVLFAATLALRIYYLFAYPFDSDEPQHLHVAWGWSQGLLQYRDVFDNHMPVFHILSAPLVALIGEDPRILFFMRLAMLPLYAASLWGAYQIGRSLFGERVGLWSALFLGLLPAFFYNSLEFRTDNLWTVLLTLAVAVLVGGRWTGRRALSGGLLLGAALSVSLKTLMVVTAMTIAALALPMVLPPKPGPPGRSRQEGIKLAALVAGICVLPLAVTLFFARQNALGPFYYCVVLHNVVPGFGRWRMPGTLMGFPPLLVFLVYGVRRLVRRVEPAGGAKRLAFVTLMAGAFFLLNEMVWPVNTAPTRLPLPPPGGLPDGNLDGRIQAARPRLAGSSFLGDGCRNLDVALRGRGGASPAARPRAVVAPAKQRANRDGGRRIAADRRFRLRHGPEGRDHLQEARLLLRAGATHDGTHRTRYDP